MGNRTGTTPVQRAAALLIAGLGLVGSASATLLDRGPDLVYDDILNITWTRNANLAGNPPLSWAAANSWAANLVFAGFEDWRLPYASVNAGAGPINTLTQGFPCTGAGGADEIACSGNEMAYMFYYNLGGVPFGSKAGNQTARGGEMLTAIQPEYWSGTRRDATSAWVLVFNNGGQDYEGLVGALTAPWAVRAGDVAAVPEPASAILFGAGAVVLGWSRRRGRWR